ncbi:MAG TPA: SDR family NAD(P)-dependent oxidoreductase [Actinocrinis sp.]|nr:SDR family NAD(P)-dependent oxidoreductase [Actinocrinis sp.]
MNNRPVRLDSHRFGPWAVVTGASSGIGREFARQLAATGVNVVLASRRADLLAEFGQELAARHSVDYRSVPIDLSDPAAPAELAHATADLDVGLLVSNAGDMLLGEFTGHEPAALLREMQLNATAHLALIRYFAPRLVRRGSGGILLVSSMAGLQGVSHIANYAATKAYILTLGEGVHRELAPHGVHVTVLIPGATDTPMVARFGAKDTPMGRLLMPAEDCAREGLEALRANRAARISGRMNRVTVRLTPHNLRGRMFGAMNRSMSERVGPQVPANSR